MSGMFTAQRVGIAFGLLVLSVVAVIAAIFGPYVRDDMRLDRIVRTVALDWRDFGEDKARTRLQYELDAQSIGAAIGDDNCTLTKDQDHRTVSCAWNVDVLIPGIGVSVPMSFESKALVAPDGDLQ